MASRREFPPDVAAALDRVPDAGSRFASLPPDAQAAWLAWIDRARGSRARAGRIDEMTRRLLPSAAVAEEQVAEPVGPPPERYWWLWLLLLLLLVVGGLLAWYFLSRGDDKAVVPNVIGLQQQQAEIRIQDEDLEPLPHPAPSNRPQGVVFGERIGRGMLQISMATRRPGVVQRRLPMQNARLPEACGLGSTGLKQSRTNSGADASIRGKTCIAY
jgi:hypothetical protein